MSDRPSVVRHVGAITGLCLLAVASISYPYFPGRYDALSQAISGIVQAFGLLGTLILAPVGLAWGSVNGWNGARRRRGLPALGFGASFPVVGAFSALLVALILAVAAAAAVGYSLGLLISAPIVYYAARRRHRIGAATHTPFSSVAPWYLVLLPITVLAVQLVLTHPLTDRSRLQSMKNARELLAGIEHHRIVHGQYPPSLAAVHGDYDPGVVGIQQYRYSASRDGYNLFFEQPLFLLDGIGTREFVVYNSRDEHLLVSHDAWILELGPEVASVNQGWHSATDTGVAHWKAFRFD